MTHETSDARRVSQLSYRARIQQVALSITDQGFFVGGIFVANVVLARAVSKEEYGMFALIYSVFNFLTGIHNAVVLEPYSIYGPGRYRADEPAYRWLIWRNNAFLGAGLTLLLLIIWTLVRLIRPEAALGSLLGLAASSAIILTGSLLRRMLYVSRKVWTAARMSFAFFLTVVILLGVAWRESALSGLTVFIIFAIGSIVGGITVFSDLPRMTQLETFTHAYSDHWRRHWIYARWVLATAFVFQFATQAYYWLTAGLLSLKEVAGLRALVMLAAPVDQIYSAITQLVLPVMATRYAAKGVAPLMALWRQNLAIFSLIGGAFLITVLMIGNPLMHVMYSGKFDDVTKFLVPLSLVPLTMGIGHTMNAALKAVEKPNAPFYAYVASGVGTFAVGIPLILKFGLRGAVYGMIASGALYTLVLAICFIIQMPKPLRAKEATAKDELMTI